MEKMALIYRGNVEKLAEEAENAKDSIDQRYLEILGQKRYEKLERTANRVLTPESFFNSPEEYHAFFGGRPIPADSPSKLIFTSKVDPRTNKKGRLLSNQAKVGYGFYVSEDSFTHSGSSRVTDNILASYVHEFDHFVLSALQRTPLYLAGVILSEDTGSVENQSHLVNLARRLQREDLLVDEKVRQMTLASSTYALYDIWENSTRILDKMVLDSVGIDIPLDWRGTERKYGVWGIPQIPKGFAVPVSGDPFRGLEDQEVMDRILDWQNHFQPTNRISYIENLYDSLKNLNVQTLSVNELVKQSKKPKRNRRKRR
jgi:hypothetical protein